MQELKDAAADIRYLLGRGYPRERVLSLVGDRYAMAAERRQMLRRGVHSPEASGRRLAKRVGLEAVRGRVVGVDGHNVLITLETALTGGTLVLADDGWVRDIAQRGRHHQPGEATWRAAEMAAGALTEAGAAGALFWLDAPLPKSGQVAARLRELLAAAGLEGGAATVPVPERELLAHEGPVAGSDTAVIDAVDQPLDLAGEIIARLDGIHLEDFSS